MAFISIGSRRLLVAVVPALLCSAALAQDRGALPLDEALRIAEERSQQLHADDAAAHAAREMALSAAEAPDHAGADPRSGADQQQMIGINRLGHMPPPV